MTPKEKALELLDKFLDITLVDYILTDTAEQVNAKCIEDLKLCKQCALIAVDEIIYINSMEDYQHRMIYVSHKNDYWNEVKQEILAL